jgi:hypothetical protein
MEPRIISSIGLSLDIIGAWLLAVELLNVRAYYK